MLLTDIELNLQEINLEERKKMKRLFFEKWNILFKPHEEAYEIEKWTDCDLKIDSIINL